MRNISKINLGGEIYEIKDRTVPFEAGSGENSAAHKTGSAVAAGMNSVAEGGLDASNPTTAVGEASHAEGVSAYAAGEGSHAEGYFSNAIGEYSHAEGGNESDVYGTLSLSKVSDEDAPEHTYMVTHGTPVKGTAHKGYIITDIITEGGVVYVTLSDDLPYEETTLYGIVFASAASNACSHAEGSLTAAEGVASHSEGAMTLAEGYAAHAEGEATSATNDQSHAEGRNTMSSGDAAHAEGIGSHAIGMATHSEGKDTRARGEASHAEGVASVTADPPGSGVIAEWNDGYAAHAEGHLTTAYGRASHTEGNNTIANNPSEHAEGQYNISHYAASQYGHSGNTQHSIGIGTNNDTPDEKCRKNAVEVMQDGSVYIYGVGGYNGHDLEDASTLQAVIGSNHTPFEFGEGENSARLRTGYAEASGANSVAEGGISEFPYHEGKSDERIVTVPNKTEAFGIVSHAEGIGTIASGQGAHAEGHIAITNDRIAFPVSGKFDDHGQEFSFTISGDVSETRKGATRYKLDNRDYYLSLPCKAGELLYILGPDNSWHSAGDDSITEIDIQYEQTIITTEAIGRGAHAEGLGTKSNGSGTHSEGIGTEANANSSHSEGYYTKTVDGEGNHTEGMYSQAKGNAAHAEGYETYTRGTAAHAEGRRSNALGYGAHAEGGYVKEGDIKVTVAALSNDEFEVLAGFPIVGTAYKGVKITSYDASTSVVKFDYPDTIYEWLDGKDSISIYPSTTAVGAAAHAEGSSTIAYGNAAHSEGKKTSASGDYSHAEGWGTLAEAAQSHAEGDSTKAQGENSHVEGLETVASGKNAHAEGLKTIAIGPSAHVEGDSNTAGGDCDHVEGYLNTSNGVGNHVAGRQNRVNGEYNDVAGKNCIVEGDNNLVFGVKKTVNLAGVSIGTSKPSGKTYQIKTTEHRAYIGLLIAVGSYFYIDGVKYTVAKVYVDSYSIGLDKSIGGSGTFEDITFINDKITIKEVSGPHHIEGNYAGYQCYDYDGDGCEFNILNEAFAGLYNSKYNVVCKAYTTDIGSGVELYNIDGTVPIFEIPRTSAEDMEFYPVTVANKDGEIVLNNFRIEENGDVYVNGVGGYYGNNSEDASTLQEVVSSGCGSPFSAGSGENSAQLTTGFTIAPGKNAVAESGIDEILYHEGQADERTITIPSNTIASGLASHAEGIGAIASGEGAHAEGSVAVEEIPERIAVERNDATHTWQEGGTYLRTEGNRIFYSFDGLAGAAFVFSPIVRGITIPVYVDDPDEPCEFGTLVGTSDETAGDCVLVSEAKGRATHAEGCGTSANDTAAHAEGYLTVADKGTSHAEGEGSKALGYHSHAEGYYSIASATTAHAEGNRTTASGVDAHAEGDRTIASGVHSHAEGRITNAAADSAHAEGYQTTANAEASHAEGFQTWTSVDAKYSHAEGVSTVTNGRGAHAEGYSAKAIGKYSHAEGTGTVAGGSDSTARREEGDNTDGNYSHAEGNGTWAQGVNSHAEGKLSTAVGAICHAEGWDTIADGSQSHAEGRRSYANGNGAHAEGYSSGSKTDPHILRASGNGVHAEGVDTVAGNKDDVTRQTASDSNDKIAMHAEGHATYATAHAAHAEGLNSWCDGKYGHAEGWDTIVWNAGGHAEGHATLAGYDDSWSPSPRTENQPNGWFTHAEGDATNARGFASHAEGILTSADGVASHAEGEKNIANGKWSHAEGYWNYAENECEHAEGKYNSSTNNVTISSIGVGTSPALRKNAFEVTVDGSVYVLGLGGYSGTYNLESIDLKSALNTTIETTLDQYDLDKTPVICTFTSEQSATIRAFVERGLECNLIISCKVDDDDDVTERARVDTSIVDSVNDNVVLVYRLLDGDTFSTIPCIGVCQ